MAKCFVGTNGGGKVTVEGLTSDAIIGGNTVVVKQGAKVIQQVKGEAAGFLSSGGGPKWGNGTYQLGTYPAGKYRITLYSFGWTAGETSTTTMKAGATSILSVTAGASNYATNSKEFETTQEQAFTVTNGGYSGGCVYILVKLPDSE